MFFLDQGEVFLIFSLILIKKCTLIFLDFELELYQKNKKLRLIEKRGSWSFYWFWVKEWGVFIKVTFTLRIITWSKKSQNLFKKCLIISKSSPWSLKVSAHDLDKKPHQYKKTTSILKAPKPHFYWYHPLIYSQDQRCRL